MRILAADTTTSILAIAVCEWGAPLAFREAAGIAAEVVVECGRAHSERLLEATDWVLRQAGCGLDDMDALAISVGPGSFTGVRIGVAAFKGLAFGGGPSGKNLPLVPVPTLDAMTRVGVFSDGVVCPMLDARMHEVYGAVYRFREGGRERIAPDRVCPVERMIEAIEEPALFLGDGADLYRDRILAARPDARFAPPHCSVPRAAAVAAEAVYLLDAEVCTDPALVVPVYLRKSQPEQKREVKGS
jgi:tRNA threonylcarbamoyladenosine biosynthesis protein TsaB